MKKYLFGLIFLALPFLTQAADYTEVAVRIETGSKTIFDDVVYVSSDGCTIADSEKFDHEITGDMAICAVAAAAEIGGFTYEFIDSDFGLYLNAINQTAGEGSDYWGFAVNYQSASVGLADYDLEQGDQVLLTYGEYPNTPLKLTTRKQQVIVGQTIFATVKLYDEVTGEFTPVSGATVHFGKDTRTTNASGKAHFKTTTEKIPLSVWAVADDSTQSNTAYVRVYERTAALDTVDSIDRSSAVTSALGYMDTVLADETTSQGLVEWLAISASGDNTLHDSLVTLVTSYEPTVADGASELARHILAIEALDLDARDTAGIDYIARLKNTQSNGQFGSAAYVNDDIYAGLALLAASEDMSSPALQDALEASITSVNDDGGVSYAVSAEESDVDTTAAFVQLLAAVRSYDDTTSVDTNTVRAAAVRYLDDQQNLDGGWSYAAHGPSNSSSTAVALQAMISVGKKPNTIHRNNQSGYNYLLNTQRNSGAFKYDLNGSDSSEELNTAYAVMALTKNVLY